MERNKACYDAALDRLIGYLPSRTRTAAVISLNVEVSFNQKLSEAESSLGSAGDADGKGKVTKSDSQQPRTDLAHHNESFQQEEIQIQGAVNKPVVESDNNPTAYDPTCSEKVQSVQRAMKNNVQEQNDEEFPPVRRSLKTRSHLDNKIISEPPRLQKIQCRRIKSV